MRTWKIAPLRLPCGAAPGCWIADGQPYLELQLRTGAKLTRCAAHADEAVPAVIEGHAGPAPGFTSTRQLSRSLQRDVKMKAAHDGD